MGISSWLPQVLALVPSLGAAVIGLVVNRKKRVMGELEKLLDLRERCDSGSVEEQNLDAAIEAVSQRLSLTMRRRVVGSGVAAVIFVGLVVFGAMYPIWLWVFNSGAWYAWAIAVFLTAVSVGIVASGFPSMFKTGEEIAESEKKRAAKKQAASVRA